MSITLSEPRFRSIPHFTRRAAYAVDVSWRYLTKQIEMDIEEMGLDLNPDFQRGHVWDQDKKIAFVEFVLRGGDSAQNLYFNCPGWDAGALGPYVLVDGKQRIDATLGFMADKVPAFGYLYSEFTDKMACMTGPGFKWHVNNLETRSEVLNWYLDLNTGGVVHTLDEIERVRSLLAKEEEMTKDGIAVSHP